MNEVAERAGVSHQTVSRVINNSPNVSSATRERVEEVIRELNYRPSNSARALVTRHTKTIGFIAGGVNYYGPISTMGAIESVARDHGFYLSVAILDEREYTRQSFEEVADSFLDQGVEAFIFLAPTLPMVEAAVSANIAQPRIVLTSTQQSDFEGGSSGGSPVRSPHPGIKFIGIDQVAAARSVVEHLAKLGHRRCVFFSGPQEWGDAAMRLAAWRRYSEERRWDAQTVRMSTWDASESYEKARKLFAGIPRDQLPTAIVTSNDLQAFGVCKALSELGISVPRDVSVVGFDDMPGSDYYTPALTTVRPDFDALGRTAMQELLGYMGGSEYSEYLGNGSDGAGQVAAPFASRLIVRESSAAPRS
jgi:DNA-binding LacI/PurR family transcriptional regulator